MISDTYIFAQSTLSVYNHQKVSPQLENIEEAYAAHPTPDVFINFASVRSLLLNNLPSKLWAIIVEGVPKSDTTELISYARSNKKVFNRTTVCEVQVEAYEISSVVVGPTIHLPWTNILAPAHQDQGATHVSGADNTESSMMIIAVWMCILLASLNVEKQRKFIHMAHVRWEEEYHFEKWLGEARQFAASCHCVDLDANCSLFSLCVLEDMQVEYGPKHNKRGLTGKKPTFKLSGLSKNRGSDNNLDAGGLGVPFPMGINVRSRMSKKQNISREENNGERSLDTGNGKVFSYRDSSSGSTKDLE
ncbi:hypothetical protein Tco_0520863 [Tanacetum coccineum]